MADLGAPISYLVLEQGADVYDSAGVHVGTVQHVLADPEVDIFDGLIVDATHLPGGLRFADAEQVGELYERGVQLNVAAQDLHEPTASAAAMEATPDDVTQHEFTRRLRRAWDYISGNY
jgi:sporulation protein YlmC with PRC-barrel domain